jgi:hypothetical protein
LVRHLSALGSGVMPLLPPTIFMSAYISCMKEQKQKRFQVNDVGFFVIFSSSFPIQNRPFFFINTGMRGEGDKVNFTNEKIKISYFGLLHTPNYIQMRSSQ